MASWDEHVKVGPDWATTHAAMYGGTVTPDMKVPPKPDYQLRIVVTVIDNRCTITAMFATMTLMGEPIVIELDGYCVEVDTEEAPIPLTESDLILAVAASRGVATVNRTKIRYDGARGMCETYILTLIQSELYVWGGKMGVSPSDIEIGITEWEIV